MLLTSSFADTVIYISLETTPESLISDIKSLWMNDSIILILHQFGLLKFDMNGKFIQQIGTRGQGPGEYEGIFDFYVAHDTIYLSPFNKKGFLRYTFDGTFCDFLDIQLSFRPSLFSSTLNQKLAVFNNKDGKIYVYNNNFNQAPDSIAIEYGVSELRHIKSMSSGPDKMYSFFQKTSSGLLFNNYVNDTIWNIAGTKKEPAFILDTNDKLLPWDKQIEYYHDDPWKWAELVKNYHHFNLVPVSSKMFIFQNSWFDDDYSEDNLYFYQSVYLGNTINGKFRKYNYIFDDITGNQKLTWFYHIYSEDYLVGEIYPYNLLNFTSQNIKTGEGPSPAWLNQMKNIKEDDNPILVLVKVKKNL